MEIKFINLWRSGFGVTLKATVHQTVYHNIYFYCSNYIGNQFMIAIRHLGGLWYMANIPQLRAVS